MDILTSLFGSDGIDDTTFVLSLSVIGMVVYKAIEIKYKIYPNQLLEAIKKANEANELKELKQESKPELSNINKLEEMEKVDTYLLKILNREFDSYLFKKPLLVLKEFGSISEANKNTMRTAFLEQIEFILTAEEKILFKNRYRNFEIFKFKIIDFFNNKLTKLELFVVHQFEIDEKEFQDNKIIKSMFDEISKKDMNSIAQLLESMNYDQSKPPTHPTQTTQTKLNKGE